jgi:hypothetical protein
MKQLLLRIEMLRKPSTACKIMIIYVLMFSTLEPSTRLENELVHSFDDALHEHAKFFFVIDSCTLYIEIDILWNIQ